MRQAGWLLTFALVLAAGLAQGKTAPDQALPDSAFACAKERRLPYRDANGRLDAARVRASLRAWKREKWQDQADAQPALAALERAKAQLCAAGKMKCGKARGRKAKKA